MLVKKLKYTLSALLFAFALFVPFALAGCTHNYKVKVSVSGQGEVTTFASAHTPFHKSLVGETEVKEGSLFEFTVIPTNHYQVGYIRVNGNNIYSLEDPKEFSLADDGSFSPCITVTKNTKIEVGFVGKVYTASKLYFNANYGIADAEPVWQALTVTGDGEQDPELGIEKVLSVQYGKPLTSPIASQYTGVTVSTANGALDVNFSNFTLTSNEDLYFNCSNKMLQDLLNSFTAKR